MTKPRAIICFLVGAMTSTIAGADRQKHEETYCTALSAVSADLAKLDALGPSSTVSELRTTVARMDTDAKAVNRAATRINTPTSRPLVQAMDQLSDEMRKVPDSMTLDEARSRVGDDVKAVERSAKALAEESGCPEAMPGGDQPT